MVWVEASCYGGRYSSPTSTSMHVSACVCVTFDVKVSLFFQEILIQNLMLETAEEIELGVEHPLKKEKPRINWQ